MTSVCARIEAFNQDRMPPLRERKYRLMRQDPFVFLRGSCHLFYEDWPRHSPLDDAPAAWICGDMHTENFGTFKGAAGQTLFDLNDFDEAVLAPCTWELARFLVSIRLATRRLGLAPDQTAVLCGRALEAYAGALADGRAEWVDRAIATGMIGELMESLGKRRRVDLLDRRCPAGHGGKRRFHCDGEHLVAVDAATYDRLEGLIMRFAETRPEPKFFKPLDIAFRIAGTGSLGLKRYAILVHGKGSPDANYLLDLKQAAPSCLAPRLTLPQPAWDSEASRVIAVQHRVQALSPRFSAALQLDGEPYVLRALQPTEDRVDLAAWHGDAARLGDLLATMGRLIAWGQLRSGGRQGSARADEFIAFGQATPWRAALIDHAEQYEAQVIKDWKAFCDSPPA